MDEHWGLYTALAALVAAWSLLQIGYMRWMFGRYASDMDKKLSCVEDIRVKNHTLELQIAELRADLPLCYVRKEDFIRHEVTINAKLDRIYDRVESKRGET